MNTILIIDDDRLLRTMTSDLLSRQGFRPVCAGTGEEGLALLEEKDAGAVLLDLFLPDRNGLDLLPLIHLRRPEVPVIIVTAYASLDSAVEAIKKGAYDYITKPLDPVLLCNTVTKALERYSLTRANRELVQQLEERVRERTCELERRHEELQKAHERLVRTTSRLELSNRQLRETRDRLLAQEKMASLGVVAAGVAHEINNPIGFVNSNLETLSEYLSDLGPLLETCRTIASEGGAGAPDHAGLSRAAREADLDFILQDLPALLSESRQGIDRVRRIVLDLKTFSRQDNWELKEANVNDALESALTIAWNQLKYKADLKKEMAELPLLRCASTRLSQVFLNLLVNAAQAIDGRGTVRLRTRALKDRIRVMVADTGSGIPSKVRQRIFDPFFTTKQPGEGTGLGLSVAYQIVGLHGGTLKVRSLPGVGTCIIVDLPLFNGAGSPDQHAKEETQHAV